MEEIEKAYCDPARDTSGTDQPSAPLGIFRYLSLQRYIKLNRALGPMRIICPETINTYNCIYFPLSSSPPVEQSVDFRTMSYGGSPVRRLSTASSVSKPPHYILTTQWVWYWKDDGGKWLEYGQVSCRCALPVFVQ